MKRLLLMLIAIGLFCTMAYAESYSQIPCNIGGTPFFGTNYIQKVIPEKDVKRPYWNPETQPAPLAEAEIIERGKTALDAQFPGYVWKYDALRLMKTPICGWLYQVKYLVEGTAEMPNHFTGFVIWVTPDGLVPSLVPDDGLVPDEASFHSDSEEAVAAPPPQGAGALAP